MTTETLDHLAELLTSVRAPGAFCTRRTAEAEDLKIEVRGVGPLRFPISARREGRPYTLELHKTEALHQKEARRRRSWAEDLRWLEEQEGA